MQRLVPLSIQTAYQSEDLPATGWLRVLTGALMIVVMSYPTIRYLA